MAALLSWLVATACLAAGGMTLVRGLNQVSAGHLALRRFREQIAPVRGGARLAARGRDLLVRFGRKVAGGEAESGLQLLVQQAGFGDQVKSWIGTGQNLPITAEQLQQVLGSDTVKQLAARFNIPVDQISKVLAQQLPKAVDGASPNGTLPASS